MVADQNLTGRQLRAVEALLGTPTIKAAAQAAKVSYRALRTWLALPEFRAAVRDGRRQLVESALGQLQRGAAKAARTLVKQLAADRAADRIRAAQLILENAGKAVELLDLAGRIEELERQATAAKERAKRQ